MHGRFWRPFAQSMTIRRRDSAHVGMMSETRPDVTRSSSYFHRVGNWSGSELFMLEWGPPGDCQLQHRFWGVGRESAFLTHSQRTTMLLVRGPCPG